MIFDIRVVENIETQDRILELVPRKNAEGLDVDAAPCEGNSRNDNHFYE